MSASSVSHTDVLIVGAGPTGLTLACELLRRGVRCRIFDQTAAPPPTSRALAVHSRTAELFDRMGIADRVVAEGTHVEGIEVYERDRLLVRIGAPQTGERLHTRYPAIISISQAAVERILAERMAELGGPVERPRQVTGFRQEGELVTATVRPAGEESGSEETITAGWLIGCDGAHSTTRHALGIPFEGDTYPEVFGLADVELDWDRPHDHGYAWPHRDGAFAVLPLPGAHQWRLIAEIAHEPAAADNEHAPPLALFQRLIVERTGDTTTTIGNPLWLSRFTINRRMVSTYRQGRVFLAGDAAHIHSPVGGQGMNTGIQDAFNLAWKLTLAIQSRAAGTLLDTYEEERLPVARAVLRGSGQASQILFSENALLRFLRDHIALPALGLEFVQEKIAEVASELTINYRDSSLSRGHARPRLWRAGPHPGDRALDGECIRASDPAPTFLLRELRGTASTLLLFGAGEAADAALVALAQRAQALLGDDLQTRLVLHAGIAPADPESIGNGETLLDPTGALHAVYGATSPALYLIRPDGYVAFRGGGDDEHGLRDALARIYQRAATAAVPAAPGELA